VLASVGRSARGDVVVHDFHGKTGRKSGQTMRKLIEQGRRTARKGR
jgi:hypothetical protein